MQPHATIGGTLEFAPSRRRAGGIEVRASRTLIGVLTPASVMSLGLRAGDPVDHAVIERVRDRIAFERAYTAATQALARRPQSETELRSRLERRGVEGGAIDETLLVLKKEGLVDDAHVAREVVRSTLSRGGAGAPLLETRLAAKGIDAETAQAVLEDTPELPTAMDAACRYARTLSEALPLPTRARRVFAYLARRGFDEHESTEAVQRVLGPIGSAEHDGGDYGSDDSR